MDWIKPIGRTQTDIDAAFRVDQAEQERHEALVYLQSTDHDVLKAVEDFLDIQKAIDSDFVSKRREARQILKSDGVRQ